MVKRTNRIQNLDKMILEYKQEEEKFKVIEEEITNRQKEIEDLRLLILSTNFLKVNQNASSDSSRTSKSFNSLSSLSKNSTLTKKKINDSNSNKSKEINQSNSNTTKQKTKKNNLESNGLDESVDKLEKPNHHRLNRMNKLKLNESTPLNAHQTKPKGLQTISKNILNQKDNKYLNDSAKKTDYLFTKSNPMKTPTHSSIDLINRLNKIKATMNLNKLENQENPKECLGLNQNSKSINKKTRQIKSSTKLANSNRQRV